jgi:hypothetical protein
MTPKFDYSRIVMAVVFLTGAFLILNSGMFWVASLMNKTVPDSMAGLIGTALGYMGGILTSTKGSQDTQNVSVVNPPNDPVPVTTDE